MLYSCCCLPARWRRLEAKASASSSTEGCSIPRCWASQFLSRSCPLHMMRHCRAAAPKVPCSQRPQHACYMSSLIALRFKGLGCIPHCY